MDISRMTRRGLIGFGSSAIALAAMPARALAAPPSTIELFATEAGRGRNVMLLHGWTADSHDWSWQLPVLESRYRTIAVDLRGHGRSGVAGPGSYEPADYVADVEALITRRFGGERFVVIGHSMGGQIAARLAARRPDLVDGVISVDGSLGFSADLTPLFEKVVLDLRSGDPAAVASRLFDAFYDPATPPALRRWHARRVQGMPAHVVRDSFGPLFLGADQVGLGPRSKRFLETIEVPIYHLCRDPAQADRMRPHLAHPKSRVDQWRDAGHWIMQDRPDDVNSAMVAWIDRL